MMVISEACIKHLKTALQSAGFLFELWERAHEKISSRKKTIVSNSVSWTVLLPNYQGFCENNLQ